ncbi:RNA polymerase sigma factor SigB [Litchfieldia salsa]|uniref:RNA polymerase sigma factor n=1 Tax=Litchfieldia salsa TaxID=930152 RepID=A0A1H0WXX4_9BACI|nr:RNA polymerase sigma factor SigB [Litchfieldia salsa]SDP95492.1 RNA polymerase, sigma 37 subunit, RpsB/SigB [Litchfieldia salsa]
MPKPSQALAQTNIETCELVNRFQELNDRDAEQELVEKYTKLVESLARKYSRGKDYHEDIVQVGMLGLLGAIRRFDSSFGKSFESFAVPTVVGEIKRFLRDKTWSVHVPRRIKEMGPKIKRTVDELTIDLQRSPKIEEIAAYLDLSEEEVLEAMEMGRGYNALSVDHSIDADSEGGTMTLHDIIGENDEGYKMVSEQLIIEDGLHVLDEREQKIIHLTYLENLSQKDTGELLGISQMHVSRLQRKALDKLRQAIKV